MNIENTIYTRVFKSPQFLRWLQYADDLSASGKGPSAISVYGSGLAFGSDTIDTEEEESSSEEDNKAAYIDSDDDNEDASGASSKGTFLLQV
ncbi:hypothetical protein DVH05_012408 [Phytophthora capsici]|nr:hypothetical protein DVH05_012408 [Phytophthora capsici]